jgi:hypothetical protein
MVFAKFPTGFSSGLKKAHIAAFCGQSYCSGQSCYARTDDDGLMRFSQG